MITRLAISGYRSLREIKVTLGALNIVTGANGSGKSSLIRLAAGLLSVPVGLALAAIMIFVINRRSFGWTIRMELGPQILLEALARARRRTVGRLVEQSMLSTRTRTAFSASSAGIRLT